MEQYLGRKLKSNEVVHHIDGDKFNNDLSNLQLMTREEHSRLHQIGKEVSIETKNKLSEIQKGKAKKKCSKLSDDEVLEIKKLLEDNDLSHRKIAKQFSVNHTTIDNLAKGITLSYL
jgi:hypothetical protein